MATNQEVAAWLAANPTATDSQIAAAANAAGVSASQLAAVTGLSETSVMNRMADVARTASTAAPTAAPAGLLDWKSQIFSSLNTDKAGAPKQLEFTPVKTEMLGSGDGEYQSTTGGELKTAGVQAVRGNGGDSEGPILGYESTTPTTVNGLSVYAHYDPTGKLDYYAAPEATWLDDKTTARGMWNPDGSVRLNVQTSNGGGLIKNVSTDLATITQSLGPVWTAMKIANPALALVDVATDVGRSEVNAGTALNAYQGTYGTSPFETGAPTTTTTPSVPTTGTEPLSGIDLGGVGASPNTWMGNGVYGAVPTAISSTVPAGPNEPVSGIDLGGPGGSPNTWLGNGTYGAVPNAISSTVPAGSSLTAAQVIKALPLVSTVASLVGGGGGAGGGPTGTAGFDIVPIPDTWKPPTYTGNPVVGTGGTGGAGGGVGGAGGVSGGLDLSKLFTDQNLLIGTQWEGLPNQRNLTFNDIFAAGKQETPMGNPVNLNNLVSAILGQTATSQKSA